MLGVSWFWGALTLVLGFGATLDVGLGAQAYLGLAAFAAILVTYLLRLRGALLYGVMTLCAFVSLRYLWWRYSATLPPADDSLAFAIGLTLALAETHGLTMSLLGLFANAAPTARRTPELPADRADWPTVDVFVPTYNEPASLVRLTVLAATQLRWPEDRLRVHVLDDGGTAARLWDRPELRGRVEELKRLCAETGAVYRTRRDNAQAKAGNINAALAETDAELILILDCDHVPTADILERMAGHFHEDPNLAFVQSPHFFRNPDPIERNIDLFSRVPSENELFYSQTMRGLDHWNAAFFCGSAALISRRALESVGGISHNSITEDADTALEMHALGYNSAYVDRPMVAGLQPDTLAAFVQQRTRWCQGMLQILLLNSPLTKAGLRLPQRLGYLAAISYWLFPLSRLAFLLVPLSFIFFDLQIVYATFPELFAFIAPHIFVSLALNNYLFGKLRAPFASDVYEAAQSLFMAPAVLAVLLNPRKPSWKVTPKDEELSRDFFSQLAGPLALLFIALAAAQGYAAWRFVHEPYNAEHLGIILGWNGVNLVVALAAFGVSLERGSLASALWMPVGSRAEMSDGAAAAPVLIERTNGREAELSLRADGRRAGAPARGAGVALAMPGDRAALAIDHGRLDLPARVPVRVIGSSVDGDGARRLRVAFEPDGVAAERALVAALYGSSDRWVAFQAGRRSGRSIVGGLLLLGGLGLRQLFRMLATALFGGGFAAPRRSKAPEPSAPAPTPAPVPSLGFARAAAILGLALLAALGGAAAFAQETPVVVPASAASGIGATSAEAAEDATSAVAPSTAVQRTSTNVASLRSLSRDGGLVALDVATPRARFEFVVNPLVALDRAELSLGWVASAEIGPVEDALLVRLNGDEVARLPIDGTERLQNLRLTLPLEAIRPGANRIEIEARYAESLRCSGAQGATWTSLVDGQSFLTMRGVRADAQPSLADLDRAQWRWDVADAGVTLVTPPDPEDSLLTIGANLAGALALRRDQPGLVVRHREIEPATDAATLGDAQADPLPGLPASELAPGVNLLFGPLEVLRPYLHPDLAARIGRAVVGVVRPAAAPNSVVVVVTAAAAGEAHVAAGQLGDGRMAMPEASWAELPRQLSPEASAGGALRGETVYRFDTPGFLEFDQDAQRLRFALPAGFLAADNRKMTARLNYAHAPGLPRGAVLDVIVNGQIVRGVTLDDPAGAIVRGRTVQLELARFRPGENEIAFRARAAGEPAAAEGVCGAAVGADWFEVFADSEIATPRMVEVARYPDLRLLLGPSAAIAQSGGREAAITLGDRDPRTIGAAWTLAARLASSARQPLPQLELRSDDGGTRRHRIWIGSVDALDPRVMALAGVGDLTLTALGETRIETDRASTIDAQRSRWEEGLGASRDRSLLAAAEAALASLGFAGALDAIDLEFKVSERLNGWRGWFRAFFRFEEDSFPDRLPRDESFEAALAGLPRVGAQQAVGAAVYLVGLSPAEVEAATAYLVASERWSQIGGTAIAWRTDRVLIAAAEPVTPAVTAAPGGDLADALLLATNRIAANPRLWVGAALLAALVFGIVASAGLKRGHAR